MARLLIVSYPDDVHAYEVALALDDLGHEVDFWYGPDFPVLQSSSLHFEGDAFGWSTRGPTIALADQPFDAVWFRRPSSPVLPDDLDPADRPVAQRECQDFVDGMWQLLAPEAFWVNPLAGRRRADLKAVQLREAQRLGFSIPPTLMSNDPAAIREFLRAHDRVVYKPFYPAQWEHDERIAVLLTTELDASRLPDDETLRLTPGIFQRRIEKAYELRVNVLGRELIAAKLSSQRSAATRLDWRASAAALPVDAATLDAEVAERCRALVRELGLVFGCLDLIVTPRDEVVFLEVNPMGQFLWIEDACPELPLLDTFCAFLLSGDAAFERSGRATRLRHHDYYEQALAQMDAARAGHETHVESYVSRDRADAFGNAASIDRGSRTSG